MVDTENLIVSVPNITSDDLHSVLGDTKFTAVGACLSSNVNAWSRYKPIYLNDVNFHFRANGYKNNLHGLISRSYATWAALVTSISTNGTISSVSDWTYDRSKLKLSNSPKRVGDFDGYYHKAVPPFSGFFCPPVLGNATSGMQQKAYLLPALSSTVGADNPTAPGSIGLEQIESPKMLNYDSISLSDFYFGVALINKGSSMAVKWVGTEVVQINSSSGKVIHSYEVNMSLDGLTAGKYFAIPILTRAAASGLSTNPLQICFVPNCSPLEVSVTSSDVVNEDIEVVITRCSFANLIGSTDGFVQSTIRVKSLAGYNKKCTYQAYTIANGDSSKANMQEGEFNLSANGSYTFNYSVSMTASEASTIMVGVTVKSKRFDGITEQSVSATRAPLVPNV